MVKKYKGYKLGALNDGINSIARNLRNEFPELTRGQAKVLAEHAVKMAIDKIVGDTAAFEYHKKEIKKLIDDWFD